MNDELAISLYLDGRLDPDRAAAFERRLAADPALREELAALRRLQELSEGLAATPASFGADDIRVRARAAWGGWRRLGLAAAAVLVLALTHGGAYLFGAHRAPKPEPSPVEATRALLERAAELDYTRAPAQLQPELDHLRDEVGARLVALDAGDDARAAAYADRLRQMQMVFRQQRDPNVAGLAISLSARGELRFLPGSARTYTRLAPLGAGRFRFIFVDAQAGAPRMWVDEGTLAELQTRHASFRFVNDEENR